jgi:hypothetical protein
MAPDADNKNGIYAIIGADNIEHFAMRDTTLEEAYLFIVRS